MKPKQKKKIISLCYFDLDPKQYNKNKNKSVTSFVRFGH